MFAMTGHVVEYTGDWLLREIDLAAQMGVEAFVVDAGWYGDEFSGWMERRGDWYPGSWLPGGLDGVREYIHKKGMAFGLWIEPEQRWAARAKSWPSTRIGCSRPPPAASWAGRDSMALDLTNPQAAHFVEESVLRVVRDFKVDIFKIDYNTGVHQGGQSSSRWLS